MHERSTTRSLAARRGGWLGGCIKRSVFFFLVCGWPVVAVLLLSPPERGHDDQPLRMQAMSRSQREWTWPHHRESCISAAAWLQLRALMAEIMPRKAWTPPQPMLKAMSATAPHAPPELPPPTMPLAHSDAGPVLWLNMHSICESVTDCPFSRSRTVYGVHADTMPAEAEASRLSPMPMVGCPVVS